MNGLCRYKDVKEAMTLTYWLAQLKTDIKAIGTKRAYAEFMTTFDLFTTLNDAKYSQLKMRVSSLKTLLVASDRNDVQVNDMTTLIREKTKAERKAFSTHQASLKALKGKKKRKRFP